MDTNLQLELGKVLINAASEGHSLKMSVSPVGTSALISNPSKNRTVIMGVVGINASTNGISKLLDSICIAYEIDVKKWAWAEIEGFDIDEIIDKMGKEVFKRIELREITIRLCNER